MLFFLLRPKWQDWFVQALSVCLECGALFYCQLPAQAADGQNSWMHKTIGDKFELVARIIVSLLVI